MHIYQIQIEKGVEGGVKTRDVQLKSKNHNSKVLMFKDSRTFWDETWKHGGYESIFGFHQSNIHP